LMNINVFHFPRVMSIRKILSAESVELDFGPPPRQVKRMQGKIKEIKEEAKKKVKLKYDTEKYIVVVFRSREEKNRVLESLGLPPDERYIRGDDVIITPRREVRPIGIKSAPVDKSGATG